MKNKNLIIKIVLGFILLIVIIMGILLEVNYSNKYKNNVKLSNQVECILEQDSTDEDVKFINKTIIYYENNGIVTKVSNYFEQIYDDEDNFLAVKNYYVDNKSDSISIDDGNKTVIFKNEDTSLIDDSNNIVEMWYKDYAEALKQTGYTCK